MENYSLSVCAKVCKECPFKRGSLKGWLGGLSIEETLEHMNKERFFSCHMTRGEDTEENFIQIIQGKQPICRGFMISAQKSAKLFGNGLTASRALKALQENIDVTEEEKDEVMTAWEFRKYHSDSLIKV